MPIPSIEIVVHHADLPALAGSPWVLGAFRRARAADGYVVEDGQLWTPAGQLVLHTRQLRRILGSVRSVPVAG